MEQSSATGSPSILPISLRSSSGSTGKPRRRTSDGVASQGGAAYSDEAYDQSQKYRNWLASHPLVQSCVKGTPGVRNFDPQDLLNAWRQDADMSMLDLLDSPLETEALIEGRARLQRLTHLKRAK